MNSMPINLSRYTNNLQLQLANGLLAPLKSYDCFLINPAAQYMPRLLTYKSGKP